MECFDLLSAGHVENDLAQLVPRFEPCVCRVHFLQPEHGLDGDANPPCRDQWQDLALDETRGQPPCPPEDEPAAWSRKCVPDDP